MSLTVETATSLFGEMAKGKLANVGAQLRAPFETLLKNMALLANLSHCVEAVGESSVATLKTRPDYAVTVHNALIGFVELKAPGERADPRKFKDPHDRDQWERLRSLPNLLYTDGNAFRLWQNGELASPIVTLIGDVEIAGKKLMPPKHTTRS
jgi:hypothetical protein